VPPLLVLNAASATTPGSSPYPVDVMVALYPQACDAYRAINFRYQ
jgi:hypothetical protein